jgi:hypothetical protein
MLRENNQQLKETVMNITTLGSVFAQPFPRLVSVIRAPILIAALTIPSWADPGVKIASVPAEYTPVADAQLRDPVSVQSFSFQVEPETGRARIVVDYMYPDRSTQIIGQGPGPRPTVAQIPGLKYDADERTVVYEEGGKKVVCADVRDRRFLFLKRVDVEATGACVVTSRVTNHSEDDGWSIRQVPTLDTYLELR